jgi:hypothetical protein
MEFILKLSPVWGSSIPIRWAQIAKGVAATGIYIMASIFKKELSIEVSSEKIVESNIVLFLLIF